MTNKAEFDIEKGVPLPSGIFTKQINDNFLILFYELPNWVVFSRNEYDIFKMMESEYTLKEILSKYPEKEVINVLVKLLSREIIDINNKAANIITQKKLPLHIYLTNKCNLRCRHCYMYSGKSFKNELKLDDWKKLLYEFLVEYNGTELSISGGEPLISDNLYPLVIWIKKVKPSAFIKLLTNGTLIDKFPIDFYNQYIDEIQISIDGTTREINDYVRGEGHFNKVMSNLKFLSGYGKNIAISMSVLDDIVEEFANNFSSFYKNIKSIVPRVKFGIATDLMDGRYYKRLPYDKARKNQKIIEKVFTEASSKLSEEVKEDYRFSRNVKIINCGYGGTITVSSNGFFYPCGILYGKPLGHVKKDRLIEIVHKMREILNRTHVDNSPICSECVLKYVCGGTCRIENNKREKNFLIPICTPQAKEDIFYALYKDDIEFEKSRKEGNLP